MKRIFVTFVTFVCIACMGYAEMPSSTKLSRRSECRKHLMKRGTRYQSAHALVDCSRNPLKVLASFFLVHRPLVSLRNFAAGEQYARANAFALTTPSLMRHSRSAPVMEVVSPFDQSSSSSNSVAASGPLELTAENVELVLDEMRPYLMNDGGNVALVEIEGPTVKLELQGACGSCAASAMTMKMGLEKGLRDRIPEIWDVIQVIPDGEELSEDGVEEVLAEVRPFLKIAGGDIELVDLKIGGAAPSAKLSLTGASSTVNSVRLEIVQRLRRRFPTLMGITWDE